MIILYVYIYILQCGFVVVVPVVVPGCWWWMLLATTTMCWNTNLS